MDPQMYSAGWSAAVHEPSQTPFPSPAQPANAAISRLNPVNYFLGDGFFFFRDVCDPWVGAETTNPEPNCGCHLLFSPLVPAPAQADSQAAASVTGAMGGSPSPKRSWSQMLSKAGPSPSSLSSSSSSLAPTTSVQIAQRHKIRTKSTKLSRQRQQRQRQQQQHDMKGTHPVVVQHEVGSGDETTPDTLHVKEVRIRRTHTLVEKQYRDRLNAQFERLLAVLPAEPEEQEEEQERVPMLDKITSKAEVLRMATQRIKTLEQQNRELLQRQSELIWNFEATGGVAASLPITYMNAVLGP